MSELPTPEYYAGRARVERRLAEAATDPRAAAIHAELAARYEALSSEASVELPGLDLRELELPELRDATG